MIKKNVHQNKSKTALGIVESALRTRQNAKTYIIMLQEPY